MKVQCVYCEKEFEPKRSTAKFCSDICRATFYQNVKGYASGAITVRIYKLINPINDKVFYVGKTVGSLQQRLSIHLKDQDFANKRKKDLIDKIRVSGKDPLIEEIESFQCATDEDEVNALKREEHWIKKLEKEGADLVNSSPKKGIAIRMLTQYAKLSRKSKPFTVRFPTDFIAHIEETRNLTKGQDIVEFLIRLYDETFKPIFRNPIIERNTPMGKMGILNLRPEGGIEKEVPQKNVPREKSSPANEGRIAELENELKNPPAKFTSEYAKKIYFHDRKKEIQSLKAQ